MSSLLIVLSCRALRRPLRRLSSLFMKNPKMWSATSIQVAVLHLSDVAATYLFSGLSCLLDFFGLSPVPFGLRLYEFPSGPCLGFVDFSSVFFLRSNVGLSLTFSFYRVRRPLHLPSCFLAFPLQPVQRIGSPSCHFTSWFDDPKNASQASVMMLVGDATAFSMSPLVSRRHPVFSNSADIRSFRVGNLYCANLNLRGSKTVCCRGLGGACPGLRTTKVMKLWSLIVAPSIIFQAPNLVLPAPLRRVTSMLLPPRGPSKVSLSCFLLQILKLWSATNGSNFFSFLAGVV